ncbi:M14 family metallopeptidase [Oceanibacterium hippocampi]|uniref:DUF2817 domain-containing protein n=1 Tax=Oceanibacterium hippocampi TaxID=745714 RepID=A0A1Y5S5M5_9PROT|nr:M14 family metallopeptidase [Oceanibacterium hippocampi]SLN33015.1 hypothetical protein OCH7691_01253 [Oceanibacterium hippocampi]
MSESAYFSASYSEARGKFLAAAEAAGARIESVQHPLKGPSGEALYNDVAVLREPGDKAVFFTNSATHGIEGYCGSGAQTAFFSTSLVRDRPKGVAVVVSHAINPHGFAHGQRVNEDNVDLNRNFIDHSAGHPDNPPYAEVQGLLVPADWDGPSREAADGAIARFIADRGEWAFQAAVTLGQYQHPEGLFYGGLKPVWSNARFRDLVRRHVVGFERVGFIDFHTGLGPSGHGEIISVGSSASDLYRRAHDWYGDQVRSSDSGGGSVSAPVQGSIIDGLVEEGGDAEITPVALEYGTVPVMEVLNSLRGDAWLHLSDSNPDRRLADAIRAEVRRAFYTETDAWKTAICARADELTRKAYAGLAG